MRNLCFQIIKVLLPTLMFTCVLAVSAQTPLHQLQTRELTTGEPNRSLLELRRQLNHEMESRLSQRGISLPLAHVNKGNSPRFVSSAGAVFRGSLLSYGPWGNKPKYGLFDLEANTMQLTKYFSDPEGLMHPDYGSSVIDDLYYMVIGYDFGGYATIYVKYVFNMATLKWQGNLSEIIPGQDITYLAWTNTPYDKETCLSYGYFYNSDGNDLEFCSMDYPSLTRTFISRPSRIYTVLAIKEDDHQLYGIDIDGGLYKIDKYTGEETYIGDTGIKASHYHQAAVIDERYDMMYWAYIDSNEQCGLAEVELSTASCTRTDFDDIVQFADLYLISHGVNDQGPGMVEDLSWSPSASDCNQVDLSFNMPTRSNDESAPLTNALTYYVQMNDNLLATGTANPGEHVALTLNQLPLQQELSIGVSVENEGGQSGVAYTTVWAGYDHPASVGEAQLSITDGKATVSWSPSTGSQHGGYIDLGSVTYRLTRYPNGVVSHTTGTTYEEPIDESRLCYYYYSVEALFNDLPSEPTLTNKVKVGESLLPPYETDFHDPTEVEDYWYIFDANHDQQTWYWNSSTQEMQIDLSSYGNRDYLVTPPFEMKKGCQYTIKFAAYTSLGGTLELNYGDNDFPTTYETLLDVGRLPQDVPTEYSVLFYPEEDGIYRFTLHEKSAYGIYTCVTMFSVGPAVSFEAPSAPSDFTATVIPGEQTVELGLTLPTTSVDGTPLSEVESLRLYRGNMLIATLTEGLTPGGRVTYSDAVADVEGLVHYAARAVTEKGEGDPAYATAYIGEDSPQAPLVTRFTDNGDGTVTLFWDNPALGQHGGYVDLASLNNIVYEIENSQITETVATVHANEYTKNEDMGGDPGWYYLGVTAKDHQGRESEVAVGHLIKGTPVGLPFEESFADRQIHDSRFWWATPLVGKTNWSYSSMSATGDGGSLQFNPKEAGDEGVIGTRKLFLSETLHPQLDFSYYSEAGSTSILYVEIDCAQQGNIITYPLNMYQLNTDGGWKRHSIDLSPYITTPYVLVRFHAKGGASGDVVGVDDVQIYENVANDLAVSITSPTQLYTGDNGQVTMRVTNEGTEVSDVYHYTLTGTYQYEGEPRTVLLADATDNVLAPKHAKEYAVNLLATPFMTGNLTLHAVVEYAGDSHPDNNEAMGSITISENDLPTVADLTATDVGGSEVALTWSAPAGEATVSATVTDDFESYAPWSLEFGEWSTYDGDGGITSGLFNELSYPNQGTPFSFIVFNPNDLLPTATQQVPQLQPHSGNQFAAAIYSINQERTDYLDQDNWLISPELSGKAQTIQFFAKSMSTYYPLEQFEVLYSTTDNQPSSFEKIDDTYTISDPNNWTPVSVLLPAGTKYFAIRNTTGKDDTFMLMIDDITYIKKGVQPLSISGYNIYIDGELCQTVGSSTTTAQIGPLGYGPHSIYLTVLYGDERIESALSNKASVVTAIQEVVSAEELDAMDAVVYTPSGQKVTEGKGCSKRLQHGLFIIKDKKSGAVRSIVL